MADPRSLTPNDSQTVLSSSDDPASNPSGDAGDTSKQDSPRNLTFARSPSPHIRRPLVIDTARPSSPPTALSGGTHAGGILPSASFFRPSKPSQQPFSPTKPSVSMRATDGEVFPLGHIAKISDTSSEDLPSPTGAPSMTDEGHRLSPTAGSHPFVSPKRVKHSREPLLPIGVRSLTSPTAGPSKPTSRTKGLIDSASSKKSNATLGMKKGFRNSLERVFRRGLSFDSSRPSMSTRANMSTDANTLEDKLPDEERGNLQISDIPATASEAYYPTNRISILPSFNPCPPDANPPLRAVPVVNPKTGRPFRNYQRHPSRNIFFCGGRLLTGGDNPPWPFLGTVLVTLGITGLWFGTTVVWWVHNETPAIAAVGSYLCLVTITHMFVTAMQDPGILPRDLDPDPPLPARSPSDGGPRIPLPRDLRVKADVVRVKYCPTCRTYRPPRSSHCKMCDNCVDGCDHHCQWINNCVGRRNYTNFFVFLCFAVITLIFMIVTSALNISIVARRVGFRTALKENIGSAVVFCCAVAAIWPILTLFTYHLRLLLLNITTIEQIRNQAHKILVPDHKLPNPFTHGSWGRNMMEVLCRPQGMTWLDARGYVTEDKRRVNPGLRHLSTGKDGE